MESGDLVVCSVLSGNRNFEGRISPHVRANYLASPPLVVAYAIAGSMTRDLGTEPLGTGRDGKLVYLRDIWPAAAEVRDIIARAVTPEMFRERYGDVFTGDDDWRSIEAPAGQTYAWNEGSTYVQHPPYFQGMAAEPQPPGGHPGRTHPLPPRRHHHHRPHFAGRRHRRRDTRRRVSAGTPDQAHGLQLLRRAARQPRRDDGGTFANIRIRNELAPGTEGGVTRHMPEGSEMPVYDAAMAYQAEGVPLVVIAGKEYGTGSSRDWAAKGTRLLGVRAVIAESFERIHRSNLVGMGVLPLGVHRGGDAEEPRPRRQRADRPGGHRRRHHAPA